MLSVHEAIICMTPIPIMALATDVGPSGQATYAWKDSQGITLENTSFDIAR
jgi:hypothetical protein